MSIPPSRASGLAARHFNEDFLINNATRKEQAMYRIEVDRDLCSGFGSCVESAPEVFELDRSGIAALLVTESGDDAVLEAARSCPMAAIAVFDSESGEQVS